MSPSAFLLEDYCQKPSATCESLYVKKSARDHIFREGADSGIHAHFALLNSTNDLMIQNETQLEKFCKESKDHCRLFFIDSKIARDRLLVPRQLFERLIECCQVFQSFREFVVSYGPVKNDEPHEYDSPQHIHRRISRTVMGVSSTGAAQIHGICGFECAYELRYITERPHSVHPEQSYWSFRQMVVYHGVRMHKDQAAPKSSPEVQGTLNSNLIVLSAPKDLKAKLRRYNSRVDLKSGSWAECFEIHVITLHELLGTWRPYLRWLTLQIASSVAEAILAESRQSTTGRIIDAREKGQELKCIQDDIEHGILVLECLLDTVRSLARSYERHARTDQKDWDALDDDIAQAFDEKERLVILIRHNLSALREKGNSTANLYSRLAEIQAAEDMGQAAEAAGEETKVVKILSFFTVFYLPTSILGNFFSSSFVEVSNTAEQPHRMVIVDNWWVYWVVISSFTVGTVLVLGVYGHLVGWWNVKQRFRCPKKPSGSAWLSKV